MKTGTVFGRVHPAIVAVWAAITAVSRLLPTFPLIGVGGTFTVANVLVPLAGVFFGPWAGLLCAAIGGAIGQLIFPLSAWAGPFSFVIPAVGGLAAGFVMRRSWLWPVVIIVLLGAAWYAFPEGREAWMMPPVYMIGILAAILGALWGSRWLTDENRVKMFVAIFLVSLAGIVASQALGNLFYLVMVRPPWPEVARLAVQGPVERIIFALAAAIVGVPLLTALPKVGVLVGPALYEEEMEEED